MANHNHNQELDPELKLMRTLLVLGLVIVIATLVIGAIEGC